MSKKQVNNTPLLKGWFFAVVAGPDDPGGPGLRAHGAITASLGGGRHMMQFLGDPTYFRIMSDDALEEGVLFPNQQMCQQFLDTYFAQFKQPDGPTAGDQEPPPAGDQEGGHEGGYEGEGYPTPPEPTD